MLNVCTHAEIQHACWKSARVLKFSTRAENQHACWKSARVLKFSTRAEIQHVRWNSAHMLDFSMCAELSWHADVNCTCWYMSYTCCMDFSSTSYLNIIPCQNGAIHTLFQKQIILNNDQHQLQKIIGLTERLNNNIQLLSIGVIDGWMDERV